MIFISGLVLLTRFYCTFGLPPFDVDEYFEKMKRSDNKFIPDENLSLVTEEKLMRLKEVAETAHDRKVLDLYRIVNHYVEMARRNHEYLLWKYDKDQESLVLVLKQNLNGILYYG